MAASSKISDLPARGEAEDSDIVALVPTGGATEKSTIREILGGYGMFFLNALVSITPTAAGVFEKLVGATTGSGLNNFTHSAGRLTYDGTVTRDFEVKCIVSMETKAVAAEEINCRVAVNGTTVLSTQTGLFFLIAGDPESLSFGGILNLDNGDFVEIFFSSDQNATDIDFHHSQLLIKAL